MSKEVNPYLIDWALTDRCNLKCRHCRGFPEGGELSTSRALQLIDEIAELSPGWVIVEGGEPLLRGDIFTLLERMRNKNLVVHFITNAMLLGHKEIDRFNRLGIKVMISIDGASRETYEMVRQGSSFERVIQAARICADAGLLEAINFTIIKNNIREIPAFFDLAKSIGTSKVTLIGLKPCRDYTAELLNPEEYKQAIDLVCKSAKRTDIEFFFDEPFFWSAVKEWGLNVQSPSENTGIMVGSIPSCIFGQYIFIQTNGDVHPCSFAPLVVGNVKEKSLRAIWDEMLTAPFFKQIRDAWSRTGFCKNCKYIEDCRGCRSRTVVLTNDWFASDPCCPIKPE
ncbi:radical SAM/SPASM domain-containing protein [Chloroflexota bacterium]